MPDNADAALLLRFRSGDALALDALFERYETSLFQFLLGILKDHHGAEDALQETFVRALSRLDGVDPDHLRGWLFTVAYHEALLLRRRQKTRAADPLPDPDDFAKPFGDYTQKSLCWRLQYYNDPLAKLVDQAGSLQNTPERAAIYAKANDILAQDGPFAILYQPNLSITVTKRVQHLVFDPVNFIEFLTLTKQ